MQITHHSAPYWKWEVAQFGHFFIHLIVLNLRSSEFERKASIVLPVALVHLLMYSILFYFTLLAMRLTMQCY